jgi:transketolase
MMKQVATSRERQTRAQNALDELCINTIRFLAVDMVQKADSGHPGMPMGAASMAYVLWTRFLRMNPRDPDWPDRDRFVLSAGHASALLYALLHLTGFDVSLDELKRFRQWASLTPGHPEREQTPGVEVTTGPLGQGLANAVGLALAERRLASQFNRPDFPVVDHRTYAIASDGDMMEGVASEAASLAGHLRLGKLICYYDSNHVSLSAATKITFNEDVRGRFEAYGWDVQHIDDGNDLTAIEQATQAAIDNQDRPSLIIVSTHIGYGSPNRQDTFQAHGSPLGEEEVAATKKNLGWPLEPAFHIPDEALAHFRKAVERGEEQEAAWRRLLESYRQRHAELRETFDRWIRGALPDNWDSDLPSFQPGDGPIATRKAGHKVLNAIARHVDNLIGGSADLDPSTKTDLDGKGSFHAEGSGDDHVQGSPKGAWNYGGANIAFGVREHGMGGILNGIAAHGGLIPFGSTFLIFSDYMRPSIRLAALSRLGVKYVFTHDSVMLGEDGPTHQPIEHLASLRAMPNLIVLRPADANEVTVAWRLAMLHHEGPVALVFTRQGLPVIDRAKYATADGVERGAYVLADCEGHHPKLILMASGSEVHVALGAYEKLSEVGEAVRVVSFPSWEVFEAQPDDYRDAVLPPDVAARIAVEAGATLGWERYVGSRGCVIGIDRFGASAPGKVNQDKFGFTVGNVLTHAKELLR